MRQLGERDWETLVYSLKQQRCVLLVGPDLAAASPEGRSLSLAGELAQELAKELSAAPPGQPTLAEVAQQYVSETGRNDLERAVASFYAGRAGLGSALHDDLASLGFPMVVTSCHDELLEAALRRAGCEPVAEHYRFRGPAQDLVHAGTRAKPLVYHLNGSISEPQSLVLTEEDLLEFLVCVISGRPPLPSNVRSSLQTKGLSFLFLGFGMNRWHLRILLHVLRGSRPDTRSFAFEAPVAEHTPDYNSSVMFYRRGYRVDVFEVDLPGFVTELRRRIDGGSAGVEPVAPVLGGTAPKIFISYDRRNASAADRIFERLRRAGCDAWLDRKRLDGGDTWGAAIEQQIDDTDYFVLVHSAEVASRSQGYVISELNRARRRIGNYRDHVRFLIPALIDDAPLMPEVSPHHAIDVRRPEGLEGLASLINRDWQVRHR